MGWGLILKVNGITKNYTKTAICELKHQYNIYV